MGMTKHSFIDAQQIASVRVEDLRRLVQRDLMGHGIVVYPTEPWIENGVVYFKWQITALDYHDMLTGQLPAQLWPVAFPTVYDMNLFAGMIVQKLRGMKHDA